MIIKYKNGDEFYQDNKEILEKYPLDTSFFKLNSKFLNVFNNESYSFKVMDDSSYLLILRLEPYPTLVFGNHLLSNEASKFIIENSLKIDRVLCQKENYETLLNEIINKIGGSIEVKHSMDIMYIDNLMSLNENTSFDMVKMATELDMAKIMHLYKAFSEEVRVDEELNDEEKYEKIRKEINGYYYIEVDNQIVSIAKKTREEEKICAISFVYTLPKYRNKGYSRKVVSKITIDILNSQKIAYLYVDKNNPISNHLYKSIGYDYGKAKYEVYFKEKNKYI